MQELVYLLKVGANAQKEVANRLMTKKAPSHVRLSTMGPLSNYGFPQGAEGALLGMVDGGLCVGGEGGGGEAPTAFVPWQNVVYMADGTALAKKQKK